MFIAALFVITKTRKQPKRLSTDEWINNCGISIQWSTTEQQKRNELLKDATRWMNIKIIMLNVRRQIRKGYLIYHFIYINYRKMKTNL